jgi:hypothetical protein
LIRACSALLLALAAGGALAAAPAAPGYRRGEATCDGYPRAPIETAAGICAGIVLAPPPEGLRASKRVLHLPRTLLAMPDGSLLVADLGAWVPGKGSV